MGLTKKCTVMYILTHLKICHKKISPFNVAHRASFVCRKVKRSAVVKHPQTPLGQMHLTKRFNEENTCIWIQAGPQRIHKFKDVWLEVGGTIIYFQARVEIIGLTSHQTEQVQPVENQLALMTGKLRLRSALFGSFYRSTQKRCQSAAAFSICPKNQTQKIWRHVLYWYEM